MAVFQVSGYQMSDCELFRFRSSLKFLFCFFGQTQFRSFERSGSVQDIIALAGPSRSEAEAANVNVLLYELTTKGLCLL